MHIRKGDEVKVLAGKDRGKNGKVMLVNFKSNRATVEGINMSIRHQRSKKSGEKGQKIQLPVPMDVSDLILLCPHCKKPSRTGKTITEKGDKVRVCKNCGKFI